MLTPFLTIRELRELLDQKKVSASEVQKFYTDRINKYNPSLNAVIEIFESSKNVNLSPANKGPLAGIPGFFKDNICIKGEVASAGSASLKNHRPIYNSSVYARVKEAGGVVLGRTNCDEFAMGSTGEFSCYGPARNPWDLTRTPGGSSSGSSAAVCAGLAPWALGTETGGSVRQPAAFCSLVGIFPTYGLVPRLGLIPFGSSLDQCGPIVRTVYDAAIMLSVLAGHDDNDSTSLPEPKFDYTKDLDGSFPDGLTVGVLKDALESDGVDPEIKAAFAQAVNELEGCGVKIKYIDLPSYKQAIAVYFVISRAEAASNLSRIDGSIVGERFGNPKTVEQMYGETRAKGFGEEVKRRIFVGNYVLSAEHRSFYKHAIGVRSLIRDEFEQAFKGVDLIFTPTTASLPFKLGQTLGDPVQVYMNDLFSLPNNVAGMPGLSMPFSYSSENLPIGVQFIGPKLSEELIFKTAYAFEEQIKNTFKKPLGWD